MAYAGACIGGAQTAPDPDLLSNRDLNSGEVRAGLGRHLWMTGSISVKGTLIDKYAFQKKMPARAMYAVGLTATMVLGCAGELNSAVPVRVPVLISM